MSALAHGYFSTGENLHLDNTAISADIKDLSTKLMREVSDRLQVLMLVPQRLTESQLARVKINALSQLLQSLRSPILLTLQALHIISCDLPVVSKQLLKVLWPQDIDLREEQFPLHERRHGIVEYSPHGDHILELSSRLLDDAVLAGEHDGHATQVLDLGVADDERVNVEAARGQDA